MENSNKELQKIESLLKESRSVNPSDVVVDQQFKDQLREKLYKEYLDNISNSHNMTEEQKKKSSQLLRIGLSVFGAMSVMAIAIFAVGTYLFPKTDTERKEVKLASAVVFVEGDVTAKFDTDQAEEVDWVDTVAGDVLEEGDYIKTGADSKVILQLDNGSVVRLNANSEIELKDMSPTSIVIAQITGESYNRVVKSETSTHTVVSGDVSARALGTAYLFRKNADGVDVLVYESKVLVKTATEEKEVSAMDKGVVKEEVVEVKEMVENEYKNEFVNWNQEKDGDDGFDKNDITAPVVTITSPKDGSTVKDASVVVEGKVVDADSALKKVIVNGTKYYTMTDGYGFDAATGTFKVKVTLKEGSNTVSVTGYDEYWNNSKKSVTVTYEKEVVVTNSLYISSISSPSAGKVSLNWRMTGYTAPHGFKVVYSKSKNPTYPGSSYKYYSSSAQRSASFDISGDAGTYYFRVCIYNGNGACTYYTPNKTVTIKGSSTAEYATGISLSKSGSVISASAGYGLTGFEPMTVSSYKQKFTWSISGGGAPKGYKLVWSESPNPSYPSQMTDYNYYGSESTKYGYADGLESGHTYYVRVGVYKGGYCDVYSNQITVTIP